MIFSESTAKNNALFGEWDAPIKMLLESNEEACRQNSIVEKLFHQEKSTHFGESYVAMTAMSEFEPVGENGAYPSAQMEQGYDKLIRNYEWKSRFAISQTMIEDGNIIDLRKQPTSFVKAYYRTRENYGAAMVGAAIQRATSCTFKGKSFDATCADGGALFSKAHTNKLTGTQQSNWFSNALTQANLGKAETAMQNFTGDADEVLAVAPTVIVIPNDAALKEAAFSAVGSHDDPASSNNAWNYQYGRWSIWIWPYLNRFITANTAPWLLLDEAYNDAVGSLIWQDRVELTVKSIIDENTDANVWKGRARFAAGFNDWRGIALGGIASGTAL